MIVVNGLPKSGTHAVMSWLTQMGLKRRPGTILPSPDGLHVVGGDIHSIEQDGREGYFILAHVPARLALPGSVITVFRDPRNVLVSYCRHREREDCDRPSLVEAIGSFWNQPFVPLYDSYLGWHGRSVVLRYEDMPSWQVGDGASLYAGQSRDWNTRTGSPSDWRDHWTQEAEEAWQDAGGVELLARAGYGSHAWVPQGIAA